MKESLDSNILTVIQQSQITGVTLVRAGSQAATTAGTIVVFTSALPSAAYTLSISCYNANNESVGYTISYRTASSFVITPLEESTIEYSAIYNQ